ncbi:MAG: hypothetical protein ABSB19_01620 [Methylomonas sp.]|jgi:hypothetical protein
MLLKLIFRLFVLCLLLLAPIIFLVSLVLEDKPLSDIVAEITPEQIIHAKQVFERNDPRHLPSGTITTAKLSQDDLDLALNYFANQYLHGSAKLEIGSGQAKVSGTFKLPANPFGRFLNLRFEIKEAASQPEIRRLYFGRVRIPEFMTGFILNETLQITKWRKFADTILKVNFASQNMEITYRWQNQNGLFTQLSDTLISESDQRRIKAFQQRLTELTRKCPDKLSLIEILQPMFAMAQQRSQTTGNAVAENRAAILVLTLFVNQIELHKLLPSANTWPKPVWRILTLNQRDDFAKHYLISALLAAYAGTPLADAVGAFKEIEDSRGGSGFSFNDLAADRAGTRMGELAAGNFKQAKKIQDQLASANESFFMPATADLPEFMPEAEFIRRFGGMQGQGYLDMMTEIEHRVAALGINR